MALRPENGVPDDHRRSGFAFYLVMIVIISGCLMAICYLTLLEGWYGEVVAPRAGWKLPAAWANGLKIVLWDSRCLGERANAEVEAWQQLLERAGLSFRTVSRVSLATDSEVGVLVLPSATCLGEAEQAGIRGWLQAGGGLVATGADGQHTRMGRKESGEFWREIAGVETRRTIRLGAPVYVTLTARLPLGLGLQPGERWRVRPGRWNAATSSLVDGYWSGSSLESLGSPGIEQGVAVTHRSTGRGRVVWFGPGLSAVSPNEAKRLSWERLFLNGVYWVGRRPLAAVSNWPANQSVAVVVAQEVHEASELPEALAMAKTLQDRQIPATFFIRLPFGKVPDGFDQLAQLAEVAVLGSSAELNLRTLRQQKERLQQSLQTSILGFRAPNEQVDGTARRILAESGYSYYFGDPSWVSAAPSVFHFAESFLFPLDGRTLVGLPRLGKDDFEVLSQYEGPTYSAEGIAEQLWGDFQDARRLGGLYVLNYRTDLLGSRLLRPAVLRLVDLLREQDIWLASASEVADWCRRRQQIGVDVAKLSQRRMRIVVSNEGRQDLENVFIHIALPYIPVGLTVTPTVFGGERVAHQILLDMEVLQIRVPRLEAQSNQTWVIDLQEAAGFPQERGAAKTRSRSKSLCDPCVERVQNFALKNVGESPDCC